MRSGADLHAAAIVLAALGVSGCESDPCHEQEADLQGGADLPAADVSALSARCTHGETGDRCPIEDCRARCPAYMIVGGRTTVSVEPFVCQLDAAGSRLACGYRVLYDVCEG